MRFYKVIIVIPGAEFTRLAKKFEIVAAWHWPLTFEAKTKNK